MNRTNEKWHHEPDWNSGVVSGLAAQGGRGSFDHRAVLGRADNGSAIWKERKAHSSGEIRAFSLGYSLTEQPQSLCHSKRAGRRSSSLCCQGSPPVKRLWHRWHAVGCERHSSTGHEVNPEKDAKALRTLPGLVQVSVKLHEVLKGVWKQTRSQEISQAVWRGKTTNKTKENLCKGKRAWKIPGKR